MHLPLNYQIATVSYTHSLIILLTKKLSLFFTAVGGDRSAEGNSASCKRTMPTFKRQVQNSLLSVLMTKVIPNRRFKITGSNFRYFPIRTKEAITAYNVVDPGNNRIARPAAYIVRQDGTVAWKSLDTKAARVPTAEILAELGKL